MAVGFQGASFKMAFKMICNVIEVKVGDRKISY